MKIIVNSYPRSGSTRLSRALSVAASGYPKFNGIGEYPVAHNKHWIMAKHEHVMLNAKFKDVLLCTILRDPLAVISSNVDRWLSGYVGTVINGIEIKENKESEIYLSEDTKLFIETQKTIYHAYLIAIRENIDNIFVITYDQLMNNKLEVVNNILFLFDEDDSRYNREEIIKILTVSPTQKGQLYSQIHSYISENITQINSLYREILELVSKKQSRLPIKLNPTIF